MKTHYCPIFKVLQASSSEWTDISICIFVMWSITVSLKRGAANPRILSFWTFYITSQFLWKRSKQLVLKQCGCCGWSFHHIIWKPSFCTFPHKWLRVTSSSLQSPWLFFFFFIHHNNCPHHCVLPAIKRAQEGVFCQSFPKSLLPHFSCLHPLICLSRTPLPSHQQRRITAPTEGPIVGVDGNACASRRGLDKANNTFMT